MPIRSFNSCVFTARRAACLAFSLLVVFGFAGPAAAEAILLEFSSDSCPPCRAMQPIVSELIARGVPVRQVDVQAEPQIAKRYEIRSTPTYLVMQEGREVARLVGAQSAAKLYSALKTNSGGELVPTRSQIAGPAARSSQIQNPQTRLAPLSSRPNSLAQSSGNQSQNRAFEAMPSASLADAVERAQAATVRLRVHDGHGYGAGTGTIIDVHGEEALVLTCGHLFRDGDGKDKIEVDVFVGGQPRTVEGQLIDFDAGDRDIGLVAIRPGMPIEPVEVVRDGDVMKVGQIAFSFGCDRGDIPSRRDTRITGVNKYNQNIGGSNLEISGAPIDGRSGGGLFDESGRLIGVCNAADYKSDIGIYTGPGAIHWQLDRVQLGRLYQGGSKETLAANQFGSTEAEETSLPDDSMTQLASFDSADPLPTGIDDTEMIVILRDHSGNGREQVITLRHPNTQLLEQIREAGRR